MVKKEIIATNSANTGNIGEYKYISSGLYEEKKSKFYSYIFKIESETEALNIINCIRKEFKDARHVVYSYVIENTFKYFDDGEPSGTAGKMIYSLFEKQKLVNVLAVVVRYFGGVLLGAGPLSRAYLKSVKIAEEELEIIDYVSRLEIKLSIDYNSEDSLRKIIEKTNSDIINIEYGVNITYTIKVPENDIKLFSRYQKS